MLSFLWHFWVNLSIQIMKKDLQEILFVSSFINSDPIKDQTDGAGTNNVLVDVSLYTSLEKIIKKCV